jgi:hypothetical protein
VSNHPIQDFLWRTDMMMFFVQLLYLLALKDKALKYEFVMDQERNSRRKYFLFEPIHPTQHFL